MPLHTELLSLARELVSRNPTAPREADLRRGVSTAYYALFHLLVDCASAQIVVDAALRPRIARAFDHRVMKVVCQDYARLTLNTAGSLIFEGQVIPEELKNLASAFITLQEARHQADYNTAATISPAQADTEVMRAEVAFLDWEAVQADSTARIFLAELLCRGLPKR